MKIIALTDIHDAIGMATRILSAESDADLIILGGDITNNGGLNQMKNALRQLLIPNKNVFALAGNMDRPEAEDAIIEKGISIHGRGVIIGEVGFFGVGGCPDSPMRTPNELSEENIAQIIVDGYKLVKDAKVKVFVTHTPPAKTKLDRINSGSHVGSISVRMFIEYESPNIVICGHIHEARGQDVLGKSRMINCGPAFKGCYGKIEISEGDKIQIKIENCEL